MTQSVEQMLELTLHDSHITPKECQMIGNMRKLQGLKELDLSCNPIKLAGLCNLLCEKTSNLHSLEKLELYNCSIEAPKGVS